jgi:hypothetical protein
MAANNNIITLNTIDRRIEALTNELSALYVQRAELLKGERKESPATVRPPRKQASRNGFSSVQATLVEEFLNSGDDSVKDAYIPIAEFLCKSYGLEYNYGRDYINFTCKKSSIFRIKMDNGDVFKPKGRTSVICIMDCDVSDLVEEFEL